MLPPLKAGTSGFRGVTNVEVTPAHALAIGRLYADYLRRTQSKGELFIAVGHDQRHGAEMLAQAVAAGILSAGANAYWLGMMPTGMFSLDAASGGRAGVLVTGSHMPWDRVGIIPMNPDGTYCTADVTDALERGLASFPTDVESVAAERIGRLVQGNREHVRERYLEVLLGHLNVSSIYARGFRVLLDPGNGTAGSIAETLLMQLGCDVRPIFLEPKPVPDRPSECRPSSCTEALRLTKEWKCNAGFCFDGDADRILMIDEEGRAVPEDVVGAIFAREILRDGDVCVTPVDSSGLIDLVCAERGARVVRCKIGQPDTGRAIKEHRAAYAYEASAKYCFPQMFLWYDAVFAAARMLKLMARKRMCMSELSAVLPTFYKMERGRPLPPERKMQVVEQMFESARELFGGAGATMDTMDGLRFTFPDDAWLLLRPSGTEPKFRWYADSTSEERTKSLMDDAERLIAEAIG